MKVKLILLKKNLNKNKNVYFNNTFVYLFIEKLFFLLSDLLTLKTLCKIFFCDIFHFIKKKINLFYRDYIILNMNFNNFIINKNNFFELILYSKKVKGYFKLNKKILINSSLNMYILFKISFFFYKNYVISLN